MRSAAALGAFPATHSEPAGLKSPHEIPIRDGKGPSGDEGRMASSRHVIVVEIEAPTRHVIGLRERMKLLKGLIAHQM